MFRAPILAFAIFGLTALAQPQRVERNAAFFADPAKTNAQVKLFWIAVGKDDHVVNDGPKRLSDVLTAHNIGHDFFAPAVPLAMLGLW